MMMEEPRLLVEDHLTDHFVVYRTFNLFLPKCLIQVIHNRLHIYYKSKNYALTFFCQYAGLFDIYESFVVDEKEVRSEIAMG